jgi:hypothetical protein
MTKTLDRAIAACRSDESRSSERLSDAARERVLAAARAGHPAGRRWGAVLFPPVLRMTLAGALPVAVVAGAAVWLVIGNGERGSATSALHVAKVGDRVVFSIENGHRAHVVVRSARADRFDPTGAEAVVDSRFADALGTGPEAVFYRID